MQTHFLFQYGEIRNESKDVAVYHGAFGHQRNAECLHPCAVRWRTGRAASSSKSLKHPVGTEHLFTNGFTNIAGKSTRKYGKIWEDTPETQKQENAEKTCNIGHLRRNTKQKRSYKIMIKVLFICHGSIFRKRWKPWIYRMFWTLREHFTKNLLKQKISKKSLARI